MNQRTIKTASMVLLGVILVATLPQPSLAGGPHYLGGVPDVSARSNTGVPLSEVRPKSPAEQAGLQVGDIIEQLGEVTIQNLDDFFSVLRSAPPDKPLMVIYIRHGQEYQTEVVLEPRR